MAHGGSSGRGGAKRRPRAASIVRKPGAGGAASGKKASPKPSKKSGTKARATQAAPDPDSSVATGPLVLGVIPGATPGTWIDRWTQRMPKNPIELVPLAVADQRDALREARVDAALVRLPIDRSGLHVIALYDDLPVVVCGVDSHLTAADELRVDDLAGETVIVPADDVLAMAVPDAVAPRFAPPADTAEAIETVAAGVGVVIVPMSLARLHHRKDVTFRPLTDGAVSSVALAWPIDATTPLIDAFVGVVRGRTANSSRA